MRSLVNGALMSYLLVAVRLVVTLVYTPILVTSLGPEGYGVFALVGALAAYLYILDFGMNDSVLRFFVTHENDPNRRDGFLSRMLALYSLFGVLIVLVTLGLGTGLEAIFGATFTQEEVNALRTMLYITGLGAAVLVTFNPVMALLSAAERFVFLRGIEIASAIATAVISTLLLLQGFGAVAVVWVMTGGTCALVFLRIAYATRVLKVRLRFERLQTAELKRVALYAAPILVSMIAEVLFLRFGVVAVGAVIGTAAVAIFAIGATFNKYVLSMATSLSRVLTPKVVRDVDRGADVEELTQLMVGIARAQAFVILLVIGGLVVFGERFITLWVGENYALSYAIMLWVLCPYALELTGNARNIVLQVRGLFWYRAWLNMASAVFNIPLMIWWLDIFGVVGAAASTGVTLVLRYVSVTVLVQAKTGIPAMRYWRDSARGVLPVALACMALFLMVEAYLPPGWLWLICGAIGYCVVYIITAITLAVNPQERRFVAKSVQKIWPARNPFK